VALGMAGMQDPVLAQIVNLPQTTLPVAGVAYNVNSALGQSGIIGIKTGFGLNQGANFLFAASATIDGSPLTLFGCVMGMPTLEIALTEAETLIGTMRDALRVRTIIARGEVVGSYEPAGGSHSDLVANGDVTLVEWPGMVLRKQLNAKSLVIDGEVAAGTAPATLHVGLGAQQVDVPLTSG